VVVRWSRPREVRELVPAGELEPDDVHLPGLFVDGIVEVGSSGKWIEQRTTRPRSTPSRGG